MFSKPWNTVIVRRRAGANKPGAAPTFAALRSINRTRRLAGVTLLARILAAVALIVLAVPAQAAISYVGAGATASSTGSNNRALVIPTILDNDVLIAHVAIRGNRTITAPAGWTLIDQVYVAGGKITQGVYYKVGLASDSGTTATWNFSASDDNAGVIRAYRGVDTTAPIGDISANTGNSNTMTAQSINTTIVNEWIMTFYSSADGGSNPVSTPGGMTERYDFDNGGGGNGLSLAGDDEAQPTAGATGSRTSNASRSDRWVAQMVALKPISFPYVVSINRASTDPTAPATAVSWTVVFNTSMTGVDATDFTLVPGGGVTGASITSVTGSGTTWTVTANTGSGTGTLGLNLVDDDSIVDGGGAALGGSGAGNGDYTGQVYTVSPPFCTPPSNIPAGVTVSCVCDQFGRASLNPSTIYGANWVVSTSDTTGIVPYINAATGHLRLTENTGNNAKAATVPGIFPAAGNYISVEFQHYAYSGSGADGIAVTLSDYSVPAVPGAFGGSLGYAQRTTPSLTAGFAGGWIGVALDEYGNYQNPTEGRVGGPGFRVDSVGVRGSGSGTSGYNWMAGTNTLAPGIDNTGSGTPAPGYNYQVIVDARNEPTSTSVTVNRDTGSGYTQLINIPDVYTAAAAQGFTQDPVPTNWQISFTGSTGGSTNIHEIGGLRICAQSVAPPSGGTASGFNAIDEAYGTPPSGPAVQSFLNGHIYMKVMGSAFKLNVAALNNNQILTTYAAGGNKNVTLKLVDNSDGACILDNTQANYCNATCTGKTAVTGGSQTLTFTSGDSGKKQSADFTLNTAYQNLVAIMSDGTTTACSTDAFSVRPIGITSVTSSNATQTGTSGTPTFKAGADNFSLTATIAGVGANPGGYTGTPKINSASSVQAVSPATNAGTLAGSFSAATSGTGNSTATGTSFTYGEVGTFRLRGPDFAVPRIPGVYDDSWTIVDSVASKNDCVTGTTAAAYSNAKNASGKYGCYFGISADTGGFGRFIPAYFNVTVTHGCPDANPAPPDNSFTYSGQPFRAMVAAYNAAGTVTQNYDSSGFAKDVTISNAGVTTNFNNNTIFGASSFATGNGGTYPVINPLSGPNPPMTYTFPAAAKETAPVTLTLRATDTDAVSSSGHIEQQTEVRSGRLHLYNAYGSELVPLPLPMRAEYFSTDGWVTNSADTCTAVNGSILDLQNAIDNPSQGTNTIIIKSGTPNKTSTVTVVSPSAGVGELDFSAPSPPPGDGYADASMILSALPWLRFDWDGNGTDDDPSARANFGLYRGNPRNIYLRERFN